MKKVKNLLETWKHLLKIGEGKFYTYLSPFEFNQIKQVSEPIFKQLNSLLEDKLKLWLKEDYDKYKNSGITLKFDLFVIPIRNNTTEGKIFCYPSIIITPSVITSEKFSVLKKEGWFSKLFETKTYENISGEVVLKNTLYILRLNDTFLNYLFKSE